MCIHNCIHILYSSKTEFIYLLSCNINSSKKYYILMNIWHHVTIHFKYVFKAQILYPSIVWRSILYIVGPYVIWTTLSIARALSVGKSNKECMKCIFVHILLKKDVIWYRCSIWIRCKSSYAWSVYLYLWKTAWYTFTKAKQL